MMRKKDGVFFYQGVAYMKKSISPKAILAPRDIIWVTSAMEQKPDNKALCFRRACLYCLKGRFPEALADYSKALGLDSNDENLRAGLGALREIYLVADKAVNKAEEE
jgi:tetratricopeptide (TPR) repeat protein